MSNEHEVHKAVVVLLDFINEARSHRSDHELATKHDLRETERKIMKAITDFATAQQASLDAISASLDSIATGITALDALITSLQNSPGTLTPEDQAALDAIQTSSKALVAKASAIVTTPPA